MGSTLASENTAKHTEEGQDNGISHLTHAFELFSKETSRLEKSYRELKAQFQRVNLELEESNRQLNNKVLELGELTHYLNNILSNMTQGLLFISMEGRITTYNASAERILEKCKTSVINKNYWDVFSDDFFGFSVIKSLESAHAPPLAHVSLNTEGGQDKNLEIDATLVSQRSDAHQGLILLIRDITEIRRLQALANHNDRLKELGEMAASIAHEIRNPLGGIRGFAALLKRDLEDSPDKQRMADYIVQGTARLDQLVGNVLHYARPLPLSIEVADLAQLLRELCDLMRVDPQYATSIHIESKLPNEPLLVSLDIGSIKATVLNLMVNAAQASPEGATIRILAKADDPHVCIRVEDSGCGIPEEDLGRIFTPFFTTKSQGNGFGLSEAHRSVQAHGGSIEVESTVGVGTCFTIKLPTMPVGIDAK